MELMEEAEELVGWFEEYIKKYKQEWDEITEITRLIATLGYVGYQLGGTSTHPVCLFYSFG